MEVVPRTLVQNAGGNVVRVLTELRAKHAEGGEGGGSSWGVDGETGKVVDMRVYGLYESASVKIQTLKTAIEVCVPYLALNFSFFFIVFFLEGCEDVASRG